MKRPAFVGLVALASMVGVANAQVRQPKPPSTATVNATDPLLQGLIGGWHIYNGQPPVNLTTLQGSWMGAPAFVNVDGGAFVSNNADGGGSAGGDFLSVVDNGALDWSAGGFSIEMTVFFGYFQHTGTRVLAARGNFQRGGWELQLNGDFAAGQGQLLFEFNRPGTLSFGLITDGLRAGLHDVVIVMRPDTSATSGHVDCVIDGVVRTNNPAYQAPAVSDPTANAARWSANWPADGADVALRQPVSRVLAWRRALTLAEMVRVTTAGYDYMTTGTAGTTGAPPAGTATSTTIGTMTWSPNAAGGVDVTFSASFPTTIGSATIVK